MDMMKRLKAMDIRSVIPMRGKKPVLLDVRSSTWFIIATVSTGIYTDIFLYAVIVPVFPFSLQNRLNVDEKDIQHWLSVLLSVYAAALLVTAPICGFLADRVTYRRGPLLGGLIAILAATILLMTAPSLPVLVVARILQGSAASVIWVVGLALLADTVGADNAGSAMGYVGSAYSIAALIGPLLGGIVYEKAGYNAVFAMALGTIGLDILMRLFMIEKKSAARWLPATALDISETVIQAEGMTTIQLSDQKSQSGIEQAMPAAVPRQPIPWSRSPIMLLIKSRRLQTAFWGNAVMAMVMTGFDTVLPLYCSEIFGWNSLGGGLIFLAPLTPAFFSPIYGYFIDKYGPRWIGAFGFFMTIPFWVLMRLVKHDSIGQKVMLCVFLFMVGTGAALALTALMAEFTKICAKKEEEVPGSMGKNGAYASSYGIFNASWAAGSLIGAYFAGGIRQAAGWGTMTWTYALVCGVMAIPVLLFTGGWIGKRTSRATVVDHQQP